MTEGSKVTDLVASLEAAGSRRDESIEEQMGMLRADSRQLMYLRTKPVSATRATGIVVCHSVFEFKMLQSAEIAVARAAARAGFAAIYVQAPGMGDSEGSPSDSTVSARVGAAVAAASLLRTEVPEVQTICTFGARYGAAIAVLAAQQMGSDRAILWDPALSVDDYWKQTKRFARVVATLGRQQFYEDPDKQLAERGHASLLGYNVTKDLIDDLSSVESVSSGRRLGGPVVVVTLNDQMAHSAVTAVRRFAEDVDGVGLGRPKPRHVIHMGVKEAADAVGATIDWMTRRLD